MSKNRISVRKDFCVGCRNCELLCSYKHTNTFNPRRARISILHDEYDGIDSPNICRQCKNPQCIKVCMANAFELNDVEVYTINLDRCNGCGKCAEACPFQSIYMDPIQNVALKCDLCNGSPQCTLMCRKLPYLEHKALSIEKDITVQFMPGILDSSTEWGSIKVNGFLGEDIDELFNEIVKEHPDLRGILLNENRLAAEDLLIIKDKVMVKASYRGLKSGDSISVLIPLDGG